MSHLCPECGQTTEGTRALDGRTVPACRACFQPTSDRAPGVAPRDGASLRALSTVERAAVALAHDEPLALAPPEWRRRTCCNGRVNCDAPAEFVAAEREVLLMCLAHAVLFAAQHGLPSPLDLTMALDELTDEERSAALAALLRDAARKQVPE